MFDFTLKGHPCEKCGRRFVDNFCSQETCAGAISHCPTCFPKEYSDEYEWCYVDDEFANWVAEIRQEAGL